MRKGLFLIQAMIILMLIAAATYVSAVLWQQYQENAGMKSKVAEYRQNAAALSVLKRSLTRLRQEHQRLQSAYRTKMEALRQPRCSGRVTADLLSLLRQHRIDTVAMDKSEGQPFQFEQSKVQAVRYQLSMSLSGHWRDYFSFRQHLFQSPCLSQVKSEKISAQKRGGVRSDLQLYIFEFKEAQEYA